MAKVNQRLVDALRRTANKLELGQKYQWGHMGSCNCGNLAQELTSLSKAEIHQYALLTRSGDWADQVSAFCPNSGLHMDLIIEEMLKVGLTREDLINLERLSDKKVLSSLPVGERHLKHNRREDVVKYLRAWAGLLAAAQEKHEAPSKERDFSAFFTPSTRKADEAEILEEVMA